MKIPFHKWHDWIENEISYQYLKSMYSPFTEASTETEEKEEVKTESRFSRLMFWR